MQPWSTLTVPSYPEMSPADLRIEIGYLDPPAALALPHYHDDKDGRAWQALQKFYREQGIEDVFGATETYCVTLYEAEDLTEQYESNVYQNYN